MPTYSSRMLAEDILFAPIWSIIFGEIVYVASLFSPLNVYRMGILSSLCLFGSGSALFINHMRQKYLRCEKEKTTLTLEKRDLFAIQLAGYHICYHLITLLSTHTLVQSLIYGTKYIISFF